MAAKTDLELARVQWKQNLKQTVETASIKELHVFKDPTGFGKTKIFSDFVKDNAKPRSKILTLVPTHGLANETDNKYTIHLKGRNQFDDCPKKEEFELCKSKEVNTKQLLCKNCGHKDDCAYEKQKNEALKSKSVISVHQYLNTTIPLKFFKENKNSILFIDESPIGTLIQTKQLQQKPEFY